MYFKLAKVKTGVVPLAGGEGKVNNATLCLKGQAKTYPHIGMGIIVINGLVFCPAAVGKPKHVGVLAEQVTVFRRAHRKTVGVNAFFVKATQQPVPANLK